MPEYFEVGGNGENPMEEPDTYGARATQSLRNGSPNGYADWKNLQSISLYKIICGLAVAGPLAFWLASLELEL